MSPQDDTRLWPARPTLAFMSCLLVLGALALVGPALGKAPGLADIYFREQDAPVAVAGVLVLMALRMAPARWLPIDALLTAGAKVRPTVLVAALVVLAAAVAVGGWHGVMRGYPLSADEFLAGFDAAIFREGRLNALVPPEWRPLRFPLQPQYMLLAGDGAAWSSGYLPVNAMALALFDRLGGQALAGAFWAAVSIAALFGVARRLWPDRPDAALAAVVLLATSSQFLIAPMTRYAMPAHLALNLVWLWLFLRGGRASAVAAVAVGFAATGLHQVVFHPLFVAPFLLELWLARRWSKASFFTAAYLFIGLFWLSYWRLFFPAGPEAAGDSRDVWLVQIQYVLERFDAAQLDGMAKGLARFVTWQNPAGPALALLAIVPALRAGFPFRPLVVGMGLMLLFMAVAIPDQGHGWGYRYLHSFMGGVCLLAGLAWVRLTDAGGLEARRAASVGIALIAVFSLAVLLPWRAAQASAFVTPYARAEAAIARARDVDVVAVDATGMWYAADLVRNDPFLRNRPKVVDLVVMRERHIRAMCSRYRVAVFDRLSGSGLRPVTYPRRNLEQLAQNRRLMAELGCGNRRVMVR